MRIQTKQYEVYTLDEVLDKAIEKQWDINVDYEWWDGICMGAEMVGIKITEFDLDRNRYCKGEFLQSAEEVALSILDNHGSSCDTYNLAENYLKEHKALLKRYDAIEDEDYDNVEALNVIDELQDDAADAFKHALFEEYSIMLQKEYEYLTSREAIEETLRANEYEFYADGSIA